MTKRKMTDNWFIRCVYEKCVTIIRHINRAVSKWWWWWWLSDMTLSILKGFELLLGMVLLTIPKIALDLQRAVLTRAEKLARLAD